MKKAWKIVLILALCILILGEVVLGVGLLSGGSPERVWETANEHYKLQELAERYNNEVQTVLQSLIGDRVGIDIPAIPVPTPEPTPKPVITTQPKDASVDKGATAKFTVVADGVDLTYQWQWSADEGKTWKDSTSKTEGYNTATLQVSATKTRDGYLYRCIVTNLGGSVTSDIVKLTVKK